MKKGSEISVRLPPNHGWIEYKLDQKELELYMEMYRQ